MQYNETRSKLEVLNKKFKLIVKKIKLKANESSFKFISQNIAQIKLDMLKLEEETDNSLQNIKGLMISFKIISNSHI